MKTTIILFLQLFLYLNLYAQSPAEIEHHKKYWYYKSRFNNDFVSIGLDSGQSIPFNQRGFQWAPYNNPSNTLKTGDASAQLGLYLVVLATEYRLLKDKGQLNDLPRIKHEIFCALNAINRIDYFAEPLFGAIPHSYNPHSAPGPNLNGFFIRDDIPKNFVQKHYQELNYYSTGLDTNGNPKPPDLNADRGFTQLNSAGQINTNSTYQSISTRTIDPNLSDWQTNFLKTSEESQDQLYYLLIGTSLAAKLVDAGETDNGVNFPYGSGQPDLRQEAINITTRLINHVASNPLWNIRNPANNNAFVQIGQSALAYAYAIDNAGCFIKYGQDFPDFVIGYYLNNPCTDFRNAASFSSISWDAMVSTNGGQQVDQQGFYHALAGICNCSMEARNYLNLTVQAAIAALNTQIQNVITAMNSAIQAIQEKIDKLPDWAQNALNGLLGAITAAINNANTAINGLNFLINNLTTTLFSPVKVNTTEERLIFNNYLNPVSYNGCSGGPIMNSHLGSYSYFGILLRKVLHPNFTALPPYLQSVTSPITNITYPTVKQDVKNMLSSAPCEGNYNFYPGNKPGADWGVPNRFDRMDPVYKYNQSCAPTVFLGEYHGLDYMLMHNLYYLAEGAASFNNYIDRDITTNLPMGSYFNAPNKNTMGAYEHLSASNTVNSNAAAYYRAGKEIALLPNSNGNGGFSAVAGADFEARIDRYPCGGSTAPADEMIRANGNTNSTPDYDGPFVKGNPVKNDIQKETVNQAYIDSVLSAFNAELEKIVKMPEYVSQDLLSKIEVYPNPSEGNFNMAFNLGNNDNVNIEVFDTMGKVVYSQRHITGFAVIPVDFSRLAKGVYLAKFENTNGELLTKKITIN